MTGTALSGLLVAALGPMWAAPLQSVRFGRAADGRGAEVQIAAIIEAPLADVRAVVVDVAGYADWFPSLAQIDRTSEGDFEARFVLPWPLKNVRERLRIEELVSSGDRVVVTWRQLEGDLARDQGTWTLRRLDAHRTAVFYDSVVQFRRWVPLWLIARAERRAAPRLMGGLSERAQRRARARLAAGF